MLSRSHPINPKSYKKLKLDDTRKNEKEPAPDKIKSQRMGSMFDDINDHKISMKDRLGWKIRDIKHKYYDAKNTIRNHIRWHKTLSEIRPWEGFDGLFNVMITHLKDYALNEEKYSNTEEDCKQHIISTVKETIGILEHMREHDYSSDRRNEVDERYPDYKGIVTHYENGSVGYSGRFVPQGAGWAGIESGSDPRSGYFEFINGRYELTASPDQTETDRILAEIGRYDTEVTQAYEQAEIDSINDFERLNQLLKDNLYSWWN